MKASHFSPDIQEFIRLLSINKVRYVIVGGEAVIYYGYARLTGDVDFFYEVSSKNVKKLYETLVSFWGGSVPGIKSQKELLKIGTIFQFGKPPNRIDLLNLINEVTFENAWATRIKEEIKKAEHNIRCTILGYFAIPACSAKHIIPYFGTIINEIFA